MIESRARQVFPFAILIAILAVSTASIFIRFAQSDGAPSLVIAALRLTFAAALLAPVTLTKHIDEIKRFSRTEILLGAFSGIFLALHFATWISSLEYTSVTSSVVLVSTAPLWVALLSPILLKEHLPRIAIIGLALSLAGVAIIGLTGACVWDGVLLACPAMQDILQGRTLWGNFLAFLGAWTIAGYLMIGRKLRTRQGMTLIPYIFMVYGIGAIVLIAVMLISGASPLGYTSRTYAWIFLLAAVPQLVGHSTFNWALKYMPASIVAVTTLGEPIGSSILAFFILNERPTLAAIIGGVLILTGIYLASRQT